MREVSIALHVGLTQRVIEAAVSEGAVAKGEAAKMRLHVSHAELDLRRLPHHGAKYREALGFLADSYAYVHHQLVFTLDAPDDTPAPRRARRTRHVLLDGAALARPTRAARKRAGVAYLARVGRPAHGRCAVRGVGRVVCENFRGVVWVGTTAFFTDGEGWVLLQVAAASTVIATWTTADGASRVLRVATGGWQSRHRREGLLTAVEAGPLSGCARFTRNLDQAYAEYVVPFHRLIHTVVAPGVAMLVALESRRTHRACGSPYVCPTCHARFTSTHALGEHLGLRTAKSHAVTWRAHNPRDGRT